MAVRRIIQLGDPLLRSVSAPVPGGTGLLQAQATLDDLRDTLHDFQRRHGFGRGISAVQIGSPQRVIYIEFDGAVYRLVNPEWEWLSADTFRLWDDCFSFPDLLVWLERSVSVRLRYSDPDGRACLLEAEGALAELLQHEMDHLDGILAVDRALPGNSLCTRAEWLRQRTAME